MRIVAVVPDLPAVERAFDYLLPPDLADAARVRVGSIVRVPLHGRRVRGWVVDEPSVAALPTEKLRSVLAVVSAGPPPEIVALAQWAATRWVGPVAAMLRAASPLNNVPLHHVPLHHVPPNPAPEAPLGIEARNAIEVIEWPPLAPRFDVVAARVGTVGSTIVVLPDATHAGALVRGLRAAGRRVVELRGDQAARERTAAWTAALAGEVIVVGGRVAVWAPVPDVTSIVVLDDGDEALQEERAPTWHARDVAVERAARAGVPLHIIGPTPTLEAAALAPVVEPDRTTARRGWPILDVIDPRDDSARAPLLTDAFSRASRATIAAGGRVVCVLNRVGRAKLLACAKCGELARCERCGAAVQEPAETSGTDAPARLVCPQCATERPRVCLHCHGTRMKLVRIGAARLRDDLAALFPHLTVLEVPKAGALELDQIDADILVGTEAVLHGARRSAARPVGLVAYLDFDAELLAPRYRAAEQALWLLVRGARLLRPRHADGIAGRLFVQSRLPDHPALDAVRHAEPARLRAADKIDRAELGYPPFGALALVVGAPDAVAATSAELERDLTVSTYGPNEMGPDRSRTLVRADDHATLSAALAPAARVGRARGRLRVEVDPLRV